MNSSGIKRGLAAVAISAVAVTGIPALAGTAFADSVTYQVNQAQGPNELEIYNQSNVEISTKPDGTDSTVRLQAGAGRNVETIAFEYSQTGGATWITINNNVQRNDDGSFSLEWAVPAILEGELISLRVRDVTPLGAGNTDVSTNIEVFANDPNVSTINITAGTNKGYYEGSGLCGPAINLIVAGTMSSTDTSFASAPLVAWADGNGTSQDAAFADVRGAGTFSGIVDLQNYNFSTTAAEGVDQIVTRATTDVAGVPNETQDHEGYALYSQVIRTVTVSDDNNNNGGLPSSVTVKVVDQNGAPIAGVLVQQQTDQDPLTPGTQTQFPVLTDSQGEASFDQFVNNTQYFGDNDCNGTFQSAAGDRTSVPFSAGNTSSTISIVSSPEGTIPVGSSTTETVTIKDGANNPIVNRQVRITRTGPDSTNEVVFLNTNAQGQVTYVVNCNVAGSASIEAAFQDPSGAGTPLPSDPFNRKANDTVTCGAPAPAPTGKAQIVARIKAPDNGGQADRIKVITKPVANGAKVLLWERTSNNRKVVVAQGRLGADGKVTFVQGDNNGNDPTRYFATVKSTSDTKAARSNTRKVR